MIDFGKGDGTFEAEKRFLARRLSGSIDIADLDQDGLLDLITPFGAGPSGISVHLQR